MTSKLIWEYREDLKELTDRSNLAQDTQESRETKNLVSVLDTDINSIYWILTSLVRNQIRKGFSKIHKEYWENISRIKHGKIFKKVHLRKELKYCFIKTLIDSE